MKKSKESEMDEILNELQIDIPVNEVKKEEKQIKLLLPKLEITKVWYEMLLTWLEGKRLECEHCGKKDYIGYELCNYKVNNEEHVIGFICFDCLDKSGYRRRLIRDKWLWVKELGNGNVIVLQD